MILIKLVNNVANIAVCSAKYIGKTKFLEVLCLLVLEHMLFRQPFVLGQS